ncbi:hypothetical protein BOX15_Mlig011547g2 [Macrostomum lignano]|uniref:gamma-glutamylcyclotransferase n=1 Tax=Macrostomum lignano TaxID=282301 RepID=A0A267GUD6_9PLAT|nr:hypothetical protein BOX15_Mlig011547g2 [Macrostomum lignano]
MSGSSKSIWFFGYGSNMNADNLANKKNVVVKQTTHAILRGYKMTFSVPGFSYVEPCFANCEKAAPTDCVHGVAFETDQDSIDRMDRVEMVYDKAWVPLESYDGRQFEGYVYVNKAGFKSTTEGTPSKRYLQMVIDAARRAGLNSDYIAKLESVKAYKPSAETLAKRSAILSGNYPVKDMTRESLGEDPSNFTSLFGYIFRIGPPKPPFTMQHGRDVTNLMLLHYLNLPMDVAADRQDAENLPRMKLIENRPDAYEYLLTWLDKFAAARNQHDEVSSPVIGRHRQFMAAQVCSDSGLPVSQWVFPAPEN